MRVHWYAIAIEQHLHLKRIFIVVAALLAPLSVFRLFMLVFGLVRWFEGLADI